MRPVLFALCLSTAACSNQMFQSPTSPTRSGLTAAQTQASNATQLPFKGQISGPTSAKIDFPAIVITATGTGVANHLGRFTSIGVNSGTLGQPTSSGTWDFVAANGDMLTSTVESTAEPLGPASVFVTTAGTITGGTGRFAGATGAYTMTFTDVHDEATATGTFDGAFDGFINFAQ